MIIIMFIDNRKQEIKSSENTNKQKDLEKRMEQIITVFKKQRRIF